MNIAGISGGKGVKMALNYILIGKKIREFRKMRQISQSTLSEMADLSPGYISYIENGSKILIGKAMLSGYMLQARRRGPSVSTAPAEARSIPLRSEVCVRLSILQSKRKKSISLSNTQHRMYNTEDQILPGYVRSCKPR